MTEISGIDYVTCLICGHVAKTLARHLKATHSISAADYRVQFGDVQIRSAQLTEKRSLAAKNRKRTGKGDTKTVMCPKCEIPHEVSRFLVQGTHDFRCAPCKDIAKQQANEGAFSGKAEPQDYVSCRVCGHKAENLCSHLQSVHPELVGRYTEEYPGAFVVALCSSVRDKSSLIGRTHTEETKRQMSENAGRWNAGLTKETDARVAACAKSQCGPRDVVAWNCGLTKDTDLRLARMSETLTGRDSPRKVVLTLVDFEPYLDDSGCVDRRLAEVGLGLSWPTILSAMNGLGLSVSDKYIKARAEAAIVRLVKDDLLKFQLDNGKVSIGAAMVGLGHSFKVIARECRRHGLETFHRRIQQTACLDAVSQALGGASYVQEWEKVRFSNSKTGHRFRFDGYFEDFNLIVEFHGHQHYEFPNAFMSKEEQRPFWEESCWRDAEKERLALAAGLRYLVVREDEPYQDVCYLSDRLAELGVPCALGVAV